MIQLSGAAETLLVSILLISNSNFFWELDVSAFIAPIIGGVVNPVHKRHTSN